MARRAAAATARGALAAAATAALRDSALTRRSHSHRHPHSSGSGSSSLMMGSGEAGVSMSMSLSMVSTSGADPALDESTRSGLLPPPVASTNSSFSTTVPMPVPATEAVEAAMATRLAAIADRVEALSKARAHRQTTAAAAAAAAMAPAGRGPLNASLSSVASLR